MSAAYFLIRIFYDSFSQMYPSNAKDLGVHNVVLIKAYFIVIIAIENMLNYRCNFKNLTGRAMIHTEDNKTVDTFNPSFQTKSVYLIPTLI